MFVVFTVFLIAVVINHHGEFYFFFGLVYFF